MTALARPGTTFASPVDAFRWGEHRTHSQEPVPFAGRILRGDSGRYHLYGAWSSPESHRLAIIRGEAGAGDAVSMSWVDSRRDGRGWAFRADTGADPVNGFTLLREAYTATDPAYRGPVTVPVLWDRWTSTIRSCSASGIGADLATRFGSDALRPARLVPAIDAMCRRIATDVEGRLGAAALRADAAEQLRLTLADLDGVLATRDHLVGGQLTEADVRLWVQLVRYDAGPNAHGTVGPRLDGYRHVWRWASRLYERPAFRAATDLRRISAPLADLPPWS